ncbi:MAG TPA: PAS domain S-box protein [Gammaproteobacteria bacterium]|nr:PAS domain S-box protein [Gammaproteobacteria bacterium]
MMIRVSHYLLLPLCVIFLFSDVTFAVPNEVINIGVLSHRGDNKTTAYWAETAEYLTQKIPDKTFRIVPLDFDEIEPSIKSRNIHFILVNSGIYVVMEVRHRISRIATLSRSIEDRYVNFFGGVIFTLNNRSDIQNLGDLKGKSLMAVDETSLGGFQMALRELKAAGIDPQNDLSEITFGGIHDNVVMSILNGKADVGTIRTGILESMDANGLIDIEDFKIINEQTSDGFTEKHSTRLYPEWPFSKLQHTPNQLAERVAIALMKMHKGQDGESEVMQRDRWSIPLEYQPVHELLKDMRLPPYENIGQFTLMDALKKYRYWILFSMIFIVVLVAMTMLVVRLNKELKISKQRLEQQHSLILDSVGEGIYGVDLEGKSTFVNKAMERITGWSAQNIIGLNQHELLHHTRASGAPHPKEECPVYKTFMDNKSRYVEDDVFWKSDGTNFPVEYSSTPLKDESGKTIGSVVVFRDISERKKAEEIASNYRRELAHVARVSTMGEMASGMAHELNQPLTAIATNADACIRLAESQKIDMDRLNDVLEIISKQARRAGGIIQQLRNFVKKELPEKSLVNLNDLIKEVLILVRHSLKNDSVTLDIQLENALPRVYAQHIQIDQVILNLIKNAIEAMSENTSEEKVLMIQTSMTEDHMPMVTIADTGPGFTDAMRKNLFTPFVTTKPDGMGLGLSISEGIISEHGGNLYLDSASGAGAVFKFTLPTNL